MSRWFLLAAMTIAGPAWSAPSRDVEVEIQLVQATRAEPWVDPALQPVAADLKSMPYTRFERIGGSSWRAAVAAPRQVELGAGVTVRATVESIDATGASIHVEVLRNGASVTQTTVARPFDRAGILSAGRDGVAALVVPVTVHR